MKSPLFRFIILSLTGVVIFSFMLANQTVIIRQTSAPAIPKTIGEIPLPRGFERVSVLQGSFGEWLRNVGLRQDNIVRLYNGTPIARQDLHYAILDISTGNKDLQQCADAVMRLRAEYYFSKKDYEHIVFQSGDDKLLRFSTYAVEHATCFTHDCLMSFMEKVFIQCGTYTVDEMTNAVPLKTIQPGDVLVKGGAPGHAMIVMDVAENKATGEKIYLLAQSYMPAQDMHVVINPTDAALSPWYAASGDITKIVTPGWIFETSQVKRWK